MKKILRSVFVLALGFSSCKNPYVIKVAAGHDATEPNKGNFLQMKSGKEVSLPANLEVASGTLDYGRTTGIKIAGRKYSPKDVSAIQLNDEYYRNEGRGYFAHRIYKGKFDIFEKTVITTTTDRNGHSTTDAATLYGISSPSVFKGEIKRIKPTGNSKYLHPYLKDYQPSLDILHKYQQQRRVSRIVKFSAWGLWAASIAVAGISGTESTVGTVATAYFGVGLLALPVFTLTFKSGNHKRPFQAVQKYIDNNLYDGTPYPAVAVSKTNAAETKADNAAPAAENVREVSPTASVFNTKEDFLILNSGKMILAAPGTKLRSANNKFFVINNQKYTSGVSIYQVGGKLYRKFPGMRDSSDYAKRKIAGTISAYTYANGSHTTANSSWGGMELLSKKNAYFTKEGTEGYISNARKLAPYFSDNETSLREYNSFVSHYRSVKTNSYLLGGLTVAGLGVAMVGAFSGSNTLCYGASAVAVAAGGINYVYTIGHMKKLSKEIVRVTNEYNERSLRKKG